MESKKEYYYRKYIESVETTKNDYTTETKKKKNEFEMPFGIKLISLLLILFVAWLAFSINGFLPRAISAPFRPEKQKFSHAFPRTGYSLTYLRLNAEREMINAGAIKKLDFLRNEDVSGESIYYDKSSGLYYVNSEKAIFTIDKNENRNVLLKGYSTIDSFVRYNHYIISTSEDSFTAKPLYNHNEKESYSGSVKNIKYYYLFDENRKRSEPKYDYKRITEILEKNETNNITLYELTAVINSAAECKLDSWSSETKTAVFREEKKGKRYIKCYTIGDQDVKTYGPFSQNKNESWFRFNANEYIIWSRGEENDYIYSFNYKTQKRTLITEAPILSRFNYRVKDNGKLIVAGIVKYRNGENEVWVYDNEKPKPLKIKLRVLYDKTYFSVSDSVMIYSYNTEDKEKGVIYHTDLSVMEG